MIDLKAFSSSWGFGKSTESSSGTWEQNDFVKYFDKEFKNMMDFHQKMLIYF